jgi:hypothetical protein
MRPLWTRIEVWLLLLTAAVACWWALREPTDGYASLASAQEESPALLLQRATLTRDFGNARLDLEFRYRNDSPRPLFLQPPDVRLLTADESEVPPFILPSERPPQIAPHSSSDARLRFWLEKDHLNSSLHLDIRGQRLLVKAAEAFDLEKLANTQPTIFKSPQWMK